MSGTHHTCRNPYHHMDKNANLEMIPLGGDRGSILYGRCVECGTDRMVYTSELRDPDVIEAKMNPNKDRKSHTCSRSNTYVVLSQMEIEFLVNHRKHLIKTE